MLKQSRRNRVRMVTHTVRRHLEESARHSNRFQGLSDGSAMQAKMPKAAT
jgi:hypothetical protein